MWYISIVTPTFTFFWRGRKAAFPKNKSTGIAETGTFQVNEYLPNHDFKIHILICANGFHLRFFSKHHTAVFYKFGLSSFRLAIIELSWSLSAQKSPLHNSSEVPPEQ